MAGLSRRPQSCEQATRAARDLDETTRQAVLSDDGVREVF
jgi:hypothetical protein